MGAKQVVVYVVLAHDQLIRVKLLHTILSKISLIFLGKIRINLPQRVKISQMSTVVLLGSVAFVDPGILEYCNRLQQGQHAAIISPHPT